jgi:CRISPR-associated exonuclease Cas4
LDIERTGVLAFPRERTRENVTLSEENVAAVEETIVGVIETVRDNSPPPLEKKPYCDSCLYQDLCWM